MCPPIQVGHREEIMDVIFGKSTIRWDISDLPTKEAMCGLCGYCTKQGNLTLTGKRIAHTTWEALSPAAKNVLLRHGVIQ